MAGFNTSLLKSLHIPLPPLEEQHRIAAILDKADAVRRKRQEAIALTEELLRSAFLEMFGNPVTNPKGWEVVDLKSQVAELRYGTSVKCHDVQEAGDLPILRIPNIVGERISWNDLKYAELEAKEVSKLLLKPGDILFVRTNGNPEYIGRCAVFEEGYGDTLYASYLIRARLKVNVQLYPAFIRDIISFPTYRSRLVSEARTTAGNYNINTEGLGRLRLIKPPLKEQESYIKLRLQLNTREEKQKRQLIESGTLFNSLLQRAFRGEL
jgi:type I restriction enzyme S subunit